MVEFKKRLMGMDVLISEIGPNIVLSKCILHSFYIVHETHSIIADYTGNEVVTEKIHRCLSTFSSLRECLTKLGLGALILLELPELKRFDWMASFVTVIHTCYFGACCHISMIIGIFMKNPHRMRI